MWSSKIGELLHETGSNDKSSDYSGKHRHIGVDKNPMGTKAKVEDSSKIECEEESLGEGGELSPMNTNSPDAPGLGASGHNPMGPDRWTQGQF